MRLMLSTPASLAVHSAVHAICVPAHLACLPATPATVWLFVVHLKLHTRNTQIWLGCGAVTTVIGVGSAFYYMRTRDTLKPGSHDLEGDGAKQAWHKVTDPKTQRSSG